MVLHFLGSLVLGGYKSLLAEIHSNTKKNPPMCKTQYVSGWKRPRAELSHLCSSSWPSLPPAFSRQREIRGFHFYCRPQLSWFFNKRFLHLNRHKIRIQLSRTTINCQPSLLICIFCLFHGNLPCIYCFSPQLHHSSLFLPVPIHNLPNFISYPLHIEMKWGLRI